MSECIKRQTEFTPKGQVLRCLHPEAETYKQCVTDDICDGCPFKTLRPMPEFQEPVIPMPKHGGQMFLENGEFIERTAEGGEFLLGDWVESQLTRIGVTKDKWVGVKEKLGLPPSCACDDRQEWLNQVGHKFGESLKSTFSKLWS